jgi:hypothetical protein
MLGLQIKTFKFDLTKIPEGENGCDEIDKKINIFLKSVTDNNGNIIGVESALNNSSLMYLVKYIDTKYCI